MQYFHYHSTHVSLIDSVMQKSRGTQSLSSSSEPSARSLSTSRACRGEAKKTITMMMMNHGACSKLVSIIIKLIDRAELA